MLNQKRISNRRVRARRGRRGSIIMEFAFSFPFMMVVMLGSFVVGLALDRQLTVSQFVRNAGNMYARNFDFEPNSNKQVLLRAASGLDMQVASGRGVVYLSTVRIAPPDSGDNEGLPVVTERFVIGNPAVSDSDVAMPVALADGSVPNHFNEPDAVASIPQPLIDSMLLGDSVFVSEVIHEASDLHFGGFVAPSFLRGKAYF
jgi:hypothetical protein